MRLDKYLVEHGFFPSRARAKEAIERGAVAVDGLVVRSADTEASEGAVVTASESFPWVSRGALKLLSALDAWKIDPTGEEALDLGASTGGFTQALLSRGARRVYAVDVGEGQLHPSLKNDPRVVSMEKTDARQLKPEQFPRLFPLVVGDLSFISLEKILPAARELVREGGEAVFLLKPQFEVGKGKTKKGIVSDGRLREEAVDRVIAAAEKAGFFVMGRMESPIVGGEGNTEYLLRLRAKIR